ncbi:MAG: hypothetical protein GEV28_06275 [Actinophytocola sp.]|uniref:hypothetical protein n=1 Tax=Actinophytocola sp. TaxID=1872138 RepID=UPI0013281E1F|nr:hypothetical protein [Actinophytocola sp.]MPZ80013.1 hypothetical protein [Actinophytocola sp.]
MGDMSGDEIYRNFHDGDGPEGLIGGAAVVKDVASEYYERTRQIQALVGRMESVWQGEAAGAAQRGAGPLATEHELAGHALGTAQDLTGRQAGSFDEAKSRVVPVPPKPEMENPAAVFTNLHAGVDHERQVDEYNAAAQNNVDVMNGYSGASEYNTTNLPASYGDLSDDKTGISVGTPSTIDSSDFGDDTGRDAGRDPGRDAGWDTGRDPGGSSGGDPAPEPDQSAPRGPGGATPGPGGAQPPDPGATVPGAFNPSGPGGPAVSPVDATAGRTTGGAPVTGLGVVAGPGGEPGPGRGGSGGGVGGGTRGAGPRGEMLAGPRPGAEPHGSPARPGATGMVAGAGRGAAPAGGMPMGGAGRGRDGEDTERKRPEWLEGGDPDDLFDTDVLTAPPTIGAEDD